VNRSSLERFFRLKFHSLSDVSNDSEIFIPPFWNSLRAKEFQEFLDDCMGCRWSNAVIQPPLLHTTPEYSTRTNRVAFLAAFDIYFKFGMDSLHVFKDYDEGMFT
jgi:hypothetical protein